MTATERVSTDSMVIGAKNVSGLFRRGCVTTVIIVTTNMIYAEALIAFMKGFLVIDLLYHVALLFGTNRRYCCFILQLQSVTALFSCFTDSFEIKFFHRQESFCYCLCFLRVTHHFIQNSWCYLPCHAEFVCTPSALLSFRNC